MQGACFAIRSFNPDLIYHFAAETGTGQSYDEPTRYNLVNVIGTSNLIEAVRAHGSSVKRIVLAGSRAIYGEGAARDELGAFATRRRDGLKTCGAGISV